MRLFDHWTPVAKRRTLVAGIYGLAAVVVFLLFEIRITRVEVEVEATADDVEFTLRSSPGVDVPDKFRHWHLLADSDSPVDLDKEPDVVSLDSWSLGKGTALLIGQSDRYYPPYHPLLTAWGRGQATRKFDSLYINPSAPGLWVFMGIPIFESEKKNELVVSDSIKVCDLNFYTVAGAHLAPDYKTRQQPLDRREQEELRSNTRIRDASLKFPTLGDHEVKISDGNNLWFERDSGEIRRLTLTEAGVSVIYVAVSDGIYSRTGSGEVKSLMPTLYDWLMAQPLISKGCALLLALAGLVMATLRWWPKAKISEGG